MTIRNFVSNKHKKIWIIPDFGFYVNERLQFQLNLLIRFLGLFHSAHIYASYRPSDWTYSQVNIQSSLLGVSDTWHVMLYYDTLARVLRWSLCVCAGLCQLSRRITADWWRPWKCERSLRPPWGCTAAAQHAQTKTKCPYRPFTTKNGWDLSHRTEISPGGKLV